MQSKLVLSVCFPNTLIEQEKKGNNVLDCTRLYQTVIDFNRLDQTRLDQTRLDQTSAVWTRSPELTKIGLKGSIQTHMQPKILTDT